MGVLLIKLTLAFNKQQNHRRDVRLRFDGLSVQETAIKFVLAVQFAQWSLHLRKKLSLHVLLRDSDS